MADTLSDSLLRRAAAFRAFSPSTPVTSKDVFSGRKDQLDTVFEVVHQSGQHGIVYGDRGVGKTSLARVCFEVLSTVRRGQGVSGYFCGYYTCNTGDTFAQIWESVLSEITVEGDIQGMGFAPSGTTASFPASNWLGDGVITPDLVRKILASLARVAPVVLFIDEFDRPSDPQVELLFADLVKILADHAVDATIILVGVGETVSELLSGHESIHRSLRQIQMPLMTKQELSDIVRTGMKSTGLTVSGKFVNRVAAISLGLPHYTHQLSLYGALEAVANGRKHVETSDFSRAVKKAIDGASQSTRESYHRAISSNRETLYVEVLLACARAKKDPVGTFGAPDVRDQLQAILGREVGIPAFAHHLNDFSADSPPRGGVLIKRGTTRRFRYKFVDPLMPPYVLLQGEDVRS